MHPERSVLLCDSDDRELDDLRRAFSEAGYVVRATHSSAEALREAGREQASAVVTGAQLPDGTALDLAQALRGMGMDAPLVVVSGSPAHREQVRAAGLRDYFERPIDLPEIVARVNRVVERAENGRVLVMGMESQLAGLVVKALADSDVFAASLGEENGSFALDGSRASETDILLLDLDLHPEEGLALVQALRSTDPGLYIILLASDCFRDVVSEAYKAGATTFLRKPVRIAELVRTVGRHLPAARRYRDMMRRRADRSERRSRDPWYRKWRRELLSSVYAPAGSRRSDRLGNGIAAAAGLLFGVTLAFVTSAASERVDTLEAALIRLLEDRATTGRAPAVEGAFQQWYLRRQLDLQQEALEQSRRHSERSLDELRWQNLRGKTEPAVQVESLPSIRRGDQQQPMLRGIDGFR